LERKDSTSRAKYKMSLLIFISEVQPVFAFRKVNNKIPFHPVKKTSF
jgi:hypothetical protein